MLLGWGSISVTSLMAYSLTLKMEAVCFSKTCINFCQATQHHIPEDITLNSHHCEIFEPNIFISILFCAM
jgi:hypothetical protein